MSNDKIMVQFDHVDKSYSRRGRGGSLRDAIPSLAKRTLGRGPKGPVGAAKEFLALHDVSFEVREGEALGIIGHNGAGKSTILKLLAGVTDPTRGRARVNGRFAALIELGAGFHPDLTGRENVYLNGSILGLKRAEIDGKLESIVDFAGIEKFMDTPVKRYSSGMQARLGFAVAAHVEPEVLLIDEVLSVGDFAFQQKCFKRMEEFRRSGIAIVFVSHNLNAIASLCSRAILLRTGEVVANGTPIEVIDAYTKVEYTVVSDEEAAEITHMEHGRITRQMEIVSAALYDSNGRPARSFRPGDSATVEMRLRANRDVSEPIIGIGLRNQEAITAYGTNSALQGVTIGSVQTDETIVVSFALTLHLCEGTYTLNGSAAPLDGRVMMDWRENLLVFEIVGDRTGVGIANLGASIEVGRTQLWDGQEPPPTANASVSTQETAREESNFVIITI